MKLAVMQPYFLPYIGYWQLIKAVDTFVIYDDAAYIVRGWINRNNFLINGDKKLFTFSLNHASPNKKINEISIADDFEKLFGMLRHNYSNAPYFETVMKLIQQIIFFDKSNLAAFLVNSIRIISDYLHINTTLVLSSSLPTNKQLKGQEKIIDICKLFGAAEYYNAIGGQELYSKEHFLKEGVELRFIKTGEITYRQFGNEFVPSLSVLDVMMFNSREEIWAMLEQYTLV